MEILPATQPLELVHYLKLLKYELSRWLIVEVKLTDPSKMDLTTLQIGESLNLLFKGYEGRILVCNSADVLMLIDWGKTGDIHKLEIKLVENFPTDKCETSVAPPTKEGLKKIELRIAPGPAKSKSLSEVRLARHANVFLIADDDMYIRLLAKKGLQDLGSSVEVGDGDKILAAYQASNPDVILLDIHLPGLSGQKVLDQLKVLDPEAYVIMLSADSSAENVKWTHQHGAKGFLAKPFDKSRLLQYVALCPTVKSITKG